MTALPFAFFNGTVAIVITTAATVDEGMAVTAEAVEVPHVFVVLAWAAVRALSAVLIVFAGCKVN